MTGAIFAQWRQLMHFVLEELGDQGAVVLDWVDGDDSSVLTEARQLLCEYLPSLSVWSRR